MGSTFIFFTFTGLLTYALSWGASALKPLAVAGYLPILVGYSAYVVLVSFMLSTGLGGPSSVFKESLDFQGPGWGAIETGVFCALLTGALAFFVLSQTRPSTVAGPSSGAGVISLSAGMVFLSTDSLWVMFVSFEFLLISALYLLLLTSKSERVRDAALEMFLWTLVGSAGLLTGLGLVSSMSLHGAVPARWGCLTGLCFLVGFGVKVPLWPATSWLLKAHVEASVEFSILLSGYIVKVGVLGLYRTLLMAESPTLNLLTGALAVVGLFDAGSRLPAQRDLKRVVALTTVVEMNWAVLALSLGGGLQDSVAGYLCIAHCCTTTAEFFLVEVLTKRFGTRDISYIGGVALSAPFMWVASVLTVLVTIGFPGTSLFWAKYVFFVGLVPTLPGLAVGLAVLFLVFLPVFFIRMWSMVWFGFRSESSLVLDLNQREAFILFFAIGFGLALGLLPGLVFWNSFS